MGLSLRQGSTHTPHIPQKPGLVLPLVALQPGPADRSWLDLCEPGCIQWGLFWTCKYTFHTLLINTQ